VPSLRGQLLIAGPTLLDPNFHRTVVLIVEHEDAGAMGLVLNRRSPIPAEQAIPELIGALDPEDRLWMGGPVQTTSVVVLADFEGSEMQSLAVQGDLGLVLPDADLEEVAVGVRRARAFLGFAGWGPGQLEDELAEEAWIIEPPQREEIFTAAPDDLWAAVLRRKGHRYALLATMPPDPSLN